MKKMLICMSVFLCTSVSTAFPQPLFQKGKLISFSEIGALVGNPENENSAPFIFHSSLNYAFHKNLSAGAGIGFEFLRETYLPLTANLLYRFGNNGTVTPFVKLQAGYHWALENNTVKDNGYYYSSSGSGIGYYYSEKLDAKGGFMANPAVGMIICTESKLGISLSAGYSYRKLNYEGADDYKFHVEYNRLSFTLGLIF